MGIRGLNRVNDYDIKVVSTSDGYSETLRFSDDGTLYVDTDSSSSVTDFNPEFSISSIERGSDSSKVWQGNEHLNIDFTFHFRGFADTTGGNVNVSVKYADGTSEQLGGWEMSYEGQDENWVTNYDGPWSRSGKNVTHFKLSNSSYASDGKSMQYRLDVKINQSKSSSITTTDIHK